MSALGWRARQDSVALAAHDYALRLEAEADWAEAHEDFLCPCGHRGYLHDDGRDACAVCDCPDFQPYGGV